MTSQKFKFVKLWDLLAYSEITRWKSPLSNNQSVGANWWGDYKYTYVPMTQIQILWKLAWIVARIANVTIQSNLTRILTESSEHNGANISPPICTNRLNFSKCIFSILFYLHWKLKRSVSAPKCQFSPAGQSLIQPFLEPFEHNLGQKSSIKRLFQPTVGPISALGPNQP